MGGWYTIAWLLWGAVFLAVEGRALANRRDGDTLSEHVWRWFGVGQRQTWWTITRRVVLGLFMLWLSLHFLFGWLTPTHPLPWL